MRISRHPALRSAGSTAGLKQGSMRSAHIVASTQFHCSARASSPCLELSFTDDGCLCSGMAFALQPSWLTSPDRSPCFTPPRLPTPPHGNAVTFGFRPETICLKRTSTSLYWVRSQAHPAAALGAARSAGQLVSFPCMITISKIRQDNA